jgi:uncharacterized protein
VAFSEATYLKPKLMIHILYKIGKSQVHGIGLLADQNIEKGNLIYSPSPLLDVDITSEEFNALSPSEKKEVMYYGYFNYKTNKWHVAFDAIRILNHSPKDVANVSQDGDMIMTALRDIKKGEELLQDYTEIYPYGSEHLDKIYKL